MIPITIKTLDGTEIGVDLTSLAKESILRLAHARTKSKHNKLIKAITSFDIEETLSKIIIYLFGDRVTEGIGTGGWSKSASKYVDLIYGRKATNPIYESMTDTALVIEALKSFEGFVKVSQSSCEINIYDDLFKCYIKERWNFKGGDSGIWQDDREDGQFVWNHLRHTAMIVRIFGSIPELKRNLGKTAEWLQSKVLQMDGNDWQKEKIATPIAVYVAVKYFEKHGKYLSSDTIDKIRQITIDETISRYDSNLKGWHSGPFKEIALPFYSLFLLAEMPEIWLSDSILRKQMDESLKSLLGLMIHSPHGYGLPIYGMRLPDIGLSCLMLSSLLQKTTRNKVEEDSLIKLIEFVVKSIASNEAQYWANTYTWTVSYFVRDVCKVLTTGD